MFANAARASGFGSRVSGYYNHNHTPFVTQIQPFIINLKVRSLVLLTPTSNDHHTQQRHSAPSQSRVLGTTSGRFPNSMLSCLHSSNKAASTIKEVAPPVSSPVSKPSISNPFSQERLQRLTSSKVRRDQEERETKLYPLTTLLSIRNMCSMKEAIVYIRGGHVLLDGIPEKLNVKVLATANVKLSPAAQTLQQDKINIVQYKPFSFVSQTQSKKCRSRPAKELLTWENRIKPPRKVATYTDLTRKLPPKHYHEMGLGGRLDADSSGLLIWTANGVVSKLATSSDVSKEYEVVVERRKTSMNRDKVVQLFTNGFVLDNEKLLPVQAKWMSEKVIRLVLVEGKYRQIRRMLDKVGYNVTRLTRTRYGKLRLDDLKLRPGEWATFHANELLDYPSHK